MRIQPAIFPPIETGSSVVGAAAPGFALLLGDEGAATMPLFDQGLDGVVAGPGRTPQDDLAAQSAALAFAFGAFGLFAPGDISGEIEAYAPGNLPSHPAVESVMADGLVLPGFAEPQAAATVGLEAHAPLTTGPPQGHVGPTILMRGASVVAAAALPSRLQGQSIGPGAEPERGAAPSRPPARPATRRAAAASLMVAEAAGRLAVVAAIPRFDAADHGRTRERLAATAAEFGATLEDLQINGQAGEPPAAKGAPHGRSAR